jgi:hypothetical protein
MPAPMTIPTVTAHPSRTRSTRLSLYDCVELVTRVGDGGKGPTHPYRRAREWLVRNSYDRAIRTEPT